MPFGWFGEVTFRPGETTVLGAEMPDDDGASEDDGTAEGGGDPFSVTVTVTTLRIWGLCGVGVTVCR